MKSRKQLNKTLKARWVWAVALGSAIGWGAFVQPLNWMDTAGPLGVIIGFTIGALLMSVIAVSYGFLIKKLPVSGGEFAYAFVSLNRTHAFISGWFLVLGYISIVALNASAFALMFKYIFPTIIEQFYLYTIAGWDIYLIEIIIATVGLILFGYINIKGVGLSGQTQFIFALTMILAVLSLVIFVGIHPNSNLSNLKPYFPDNKTSIAAILSIIAISPWAYVGFDVVPQVAEEFNFPAKKAFILIILALLFAAGIYSSMILVTSLGVPWITLTEGSHLWGTGYIVNKILGSVGLTILVIALSMGIFTGLNGFILASSRLLFAMSRANIIPKALGELHPKSNTPHNAIIFTVIISTIAPWFGREALSWIVDMSSIGVSIAYLYTSIAAFKLFKWSERDISNIYLEDVAPIKKGIALIGIISSLIFIMLLLIPNSPAFLSIESRIALIIWIILGIVFYLFKQKEYNKISEEELSYLILGDSLNKTAIKKQDQ